MEKDGPLDGRKYNQNNKGSQMGQVTPKKQNKNKLNKAFQVDQVSHQN